MSDFNVSFTDEIIIKRTHNIASKQSTFSFGLDNTLLAPLGIISIFTLFIAVKYLFIFLIVILFEFVLKYIINLTSKELLYIVWSSFFETQRKPVKN